MFHFTNLLKELNEQKTFNQQLLQEIFTLKNRLDVALNTNTLLQEENQKLKDEIARLKGQKPKPKIPPSILKVLTARKNPKTK